MSKKSQFRPSQALPVERTISDLSPIETFFDERLFRVSVNFGGDPTLGDAARLRIVVSSLQGKSISDIYQIMAGLSSWVVGEFYRSEAEEIAQRLKEAGFAVSIVLVKGVGP